MGAFGNLMAELYYIPLILITLAILWSMKGYQLVMREWKVLATKLGVKFSIPPEPNKKWPELSGRIKTIPFFCSMRSRKSGRSTLMCTYFYFELKGIEDKTLQLYHEGLFSKIGIALGGQDVELGHEVFDNEFVVKSNDEAFAKAILTNQVQELILRGLDQNGEIKIEDNRLIYEAFYSVKYGTDCQAFYHTVLAGAAIAKSIQEAVKIKE